MKSNGDDSVVDTIFPNFATFHKDRAIRIERSTNITERCTIRRALSPINRVSRERNVDPSRLPTSHINCVTR